MMTHVRFPGAWRLLIVALFLAILTTAMLAPTRPLNAQNSPLPTPTAGAQAPSPLSSPTPEEAPTSPLPTPTPGVAAQAGQPVSNTVATTALAGTALTSPGAVAVFVLVALVMVGGVVYYRQRGKR